MEQQPLVSVCIPVYNGAVHLRECLDSVSAQDYPNIEIIVVDNASTDSTAAIIESWRSGYRGRAACYCNSETLPMVDNFNLALGYATGDWLKLLPHDDTLVADCLSETVFALAAGEKFAVGWRHFEFESAGLWLRWFYSSQNWLWRADRVLGGQASSAEQYLQACAANPCHNFLGEPGSALFSVDAFCETGGFDSRCHQYCDLMLWHHLGARYGVRVVPRVVSSFRVHDQSQSQKGRKALTRQRDTECLLLSESVLRSVLNIPGHPRLAEALLNDVLDRERTNARIPGDLGLEIPAWVRRLCAWVARLPVKRAYQLTLLRLCLPVLRRSLKNLNLA
jgi:hypothetical protein